MLIVPKSLVTLKKVFGTISGTYFYIAELPVFCSKQPLGYHSNRGRSGTNFNGTDKLCNLYNPLFGKTFTFLSHILANFVLKFPTFRCRDHQVDRGEISVRQINCTTLIIPSLVQHYWHYVLY